MKINLNIYSMGNNKKIKGIHAYTECPSETKLEPQPSTSVEQAAPTRTQVKCKILYVILLTKTISGYNMTAAVLGYTEGVLI